MSTESAGRCIIGVEIYSSDVLAEFLESRYVFSGGFVTAASVLVFVSFNKANIADDNVKM